MKKFLKSLLILPVLIGGVAELKADEQMQLVLQRERLKRQIAKSPYSQMLEAKKALVIGLHKSVKVNTDLSEEKIRLIKVKAEFAEIERIARDENQQMVLAIEEAKKEGKDVKDEESELKKHMAQTRKRLDGLKELQKILQKKVDDAQFAYNSLEGELAILRRQIKAVEKKANADKENATKLMEQLKAVEAKLKKK